MTIIELIATFIAGAASGAAGLFLWAVLWPEPKPPRVTEEEEFPIYGSGEDGRF